MTARGGAPSRARRREAAISMSLSGLGWKSKCSASWAMVRSPLTAARATFALKAGEWFRRGRLLMVSPVHGDYRRCQAEIPLIVLSKFPRPALWLTWGFVGQDV